MTLMHMLEKEPMLKMFNAYIKSKMENWIYELEKIQKSFTSKINGMNELDYHERLKKINLNSLERRRERFMIIYGWQRLEDVRDNVLRSLTATTSRRDRRIISPKYQMWQMKNVCHNSQVEKKQIYNCPTRTIQRIFNCILGAIMNLTGFTTDTFKHNLDKWLTTVPDQPRSGGYSERLAAELNSIQHQVLS